MNQLLVPLLPSSFSRRFSVKKSEHRAEKLADTLAVNQI